MRKKCPICGGRVLVINPNAGRCQNQGCRHWLAIVKGELRTYKSIEDTKQPEYFD